MVRMQFKMLGLAIAVIAVIACVGTSLPTATVTSTSTSGTPETMVPSPFASPTSPLQTITPVFPLTNTTVPPTETPSLTPEPLIPTTVPTLGPIGEVQPIPTGFVYLGDQAKLALGFNMTAGGALGSLLYNGRELVDYTDYGRYIQFSMYDGNDFYGAQGNDPYGNWGWNPIQAGSKAGGSSIIGAQVLEFRTFEGGIYIKSLGKEWGQYDQDSDIIYETWAWLLVGYFKIYTRATHTGNDSHAASTQEFPAAYFATSLTHSFAYTGDVPFTGGPITELDHVAREGEYAGLGNCPPINPNENWAAFGTADRFGLILAVPPQPFLEPRWNICLLYDRPQVGYIGPVAYFDVPRQAVREMTYYLIPGPIDAARAIVYDLMPHTTWTFDLNSLEGWHSNSSSASVADGINTVHLSPDDWLASRADLSIPTIISSIILNGRTQDTTGEICLNFITTDDPSWDSEKSECLTIEPGEYQNYEFGPTNNPAWNGKVVTQLRLSAQSPVWLEIDSLMAVQNGYAWEFEVPGDSEGWLPANQMDLFEISSGTLSATAFGSDPYMESGGLLIDAASYPLIEIRMRITAGGDSQIFFISAEDDYFIEEKSLIFTPVADGQFHTYTLDMSALEPWRDTITRLRLDPTNAKSVIEIDYIRVLPNNS